MRDTVKISHKAEIYLGIDAYIINHSQEQIKVMQVGDGSQSRMRTPLTIWSVQTLAESQRQDHQFVMQRIARCGNTNSITKDDFIELAPGAKKQLSSFYGYPKIPNKLGSYSIRLSYTNEPHTKWTGLGFHDKKLLKKVKKTDYVELVSNEIVFEVKD